MVAAVANGDTVNETSANNAEDSGTYRRASAKESWIFTTVSPSECKGRTQKPSSLYIAPRREQPVGDKHASLRRLPSIRHGHATDMPALRRGEGYL